VSGVADGQALHDYPAHDYNVFTEPGACDYHSEPYTWTNSNADQGFTLNLDAPYSSYSAINVADGQSLGRGPEFYNNMAAPNNCVGGSETSCPATDPVPPPPPAHWYANGQGVSIADGQSLRGAEFYNNSSAPGNCVGGSETTCSPPGYPVPRGPDFYNCDYNSGCAVGTGTEMAPAKEVALPAASALEARRRRPRRTRPTPGTCSSRATPSPSRRSTLCSRPTSTNLTPR